MMGKARGKEEDHCLRILGEALHASSVSFDVYSYMFVQQNYVGTHE